MRIFKPLEVVYKIQNGTVSDNEIKIICQRCNRSLGEHFSSIALCDGNFEVEFKIMTGETRFFSARVVFMAVRRRNLNESLHRRDEI